MLEIPGIMGIPATSDNGKGSGNAGNNGNVTFGSSQYDNEYTFNGESYNPNIHSQYLRARYYDTVEGIFLTEDSYLGDIRNPLTLNRYSYCIGNPLFYSDPSGYAPKEVKKQVQIDFLEDTKNSRLHDYDLYESYNARLEFYDILDQEGIWDRMGRSSEEKRISYMTDYNFGKSGRNIEKWVKEAKLEAETEKCKPDTPLYKYTEKNVDSIVALDPKFDAERDDFRIAYEKNIERYKELAEETDVPPELIAVIHYRESTTDYLSGSFNVYLHNGEQLGNVTVKEPKDIIFYDFNSAAIDAINRKKDYKKKYYLTSDSKDIVAMMCFAEVYNGLGYYENGHISPYLYSGTNVYTSGKYVEVKNEEGKNISVYKADVVDEQIGAYILLNSILN